MTSRFKICFQFRSETWSLKSKLGGGGGHTHTIFIHIPTQIKFDNSLWNGQFEAEPAGIISSPECFCCLPLVPGTGKKGVVVMKFIAPVVSEGEPLE